MTKENFIENIKEENKSDHQRNYINIILAPIAYIGFLYYRNQNEPDFIAVLFSEHLFFLIAITVMVIYSFWRIFQDYKIVTIDSNLLEEQKHAIIKKILHDLKTEDITNIANTYRVEYKRGWFSKMLLCIYVDKDSFLFNIRTILPQSEKIIVDRGQALFEKKKIEDKIKSSC